MSEPQGRCDKDKSSEMAGLRQSRARRRRLGNREDTSHASTLPASSCELSRQEGAETRPQVTRGQTEDQKGWRASSPSPARPSLALTHLVLVARVAGQVADEPRQRAQLVVVGGAHTVQDGIQDALLLQGQPAQHARPLRGQKKKVETPVRTTRHPPPPTPFLLLLSLPSVAR